MIHIQSIDYRREEPDTRTEPAQELSSARVNNNDPDSDRASYLTPMYRQNSIVPCDNVYSYTVAHT